MLVFRCHQRSRTFLKALVQSWQKDFFVLPMCLWVFESPFSGQSPAICKLFSAPHSSRNCLATKSNCLLGLSTSCRPARSRAWRAGFPLASTWRQASCDEKLPGSSGFSSNAMYCHVSMKVPAVRMPLWTASVTNSLELPTVVDCSGDFRCFASGELLGSFLRSTLQHWTRPRQSEVGQGSRALSQWSCAC